jgi:TonB family protein
MNTITKPFAVTVSLSVVLHAVAVVVLLAFFARTEPDNAVGQSVEIERVEIELVSSVKVSNQLEAEVSRKQSVEQNIVKQELEIKQHGQSNAKQKQALVLLSSVQNVVTRSAVEMDGELNEVQNSNVHEQKRQHHAVSDEESVATVAQSTQASQQQHSLLELLHSRIANNKKYPYLAKRQRREGVTTIVFVLHPDGTVENTHLVNSSQTTALDRAALSAVKRIDPFMAAQNYLKQAETFKVDVVFKLL